MCFPERNGALHCAAHYCVFGICIITNNGESVQYRSHKPFPIYKHIFALCVSQNVTAGYIPPPYMLYIKYTTPQTTLCQYNISPNMPRANFTHANKFYNYIRLQARCSVTAYVTTKGVTISPSCAQPSEKEIFDFVFEHGKGSAHFCVCGICIITNNVVPI